MALSIDQAVARLVKEGFDTPIQWELRVPDRDLWGWRTKVATILLSRTSGRVVRAVLRDFFEAWPEPRSLGSIEEITEKIQRCGLHTRKASAIKLMTAHHLIGTPVDEVPGLGPYCIASYRMFILGEILEQPPNDKVLKRLYTLQISGI